MLSRTRQIQIYGLIFLGAVLLTAGVAALLININQRQTEAVQSPVRIVEIGENEVDASVWGQNFPIQYEMMLNTALSETETPHGGSVNHSRLEEVPAMLRLWAGFPFALDHNEDRGHFYSRTDMLASRRATERAQPGACANCHSGEAPVLIEQMGWVEFNRTPLSELAPNLHTGGTCSDCHDPQTLDLTITRPALINALESRGIDVTQASRQEMRSYVCAQCHVEYYFAGPDRILTFPWANGLEVQDIETYYEEVGHTDWANAETGTRLLKIQHPEFELYSTSIHAQSGVACADCHMPYTRVGSQMVSDHWFRSPLTNLNAACSTCHNIEEEQLYNRVLEIQNTTYDLLTSTEAALLDSMDALIAARDAGATDEQLALVRDLQASSQIRWDFISSENSTGFHNPLESARILAEALNLARQSQLAAVQLENTLRASIEDTTEAAAVEAPAGS